MIARVWYGCTTPQNADGYEALLNVEIIPGILARKIAGIRPHRTFARARGPKALAVLKRASMHARCTTRCARRGWAI